MGSAKPNAVAKTVKIHRNLLWLKGDPGLLDQLLADRTLAALAVARPAPNVCAFLREHHQRLVTRLGKLGQAPKVEGKW